MCIHVSQKFCVLFTWLRNCTYDMLFMVYSLFHNTFEGVHIFNNVISNSQQNLLVSVSGNNVFLSNFQYEKNGYNMTWEQIKCNSWHECFIKNYILNALNCSSSHILDDSCIFLARTIMFKIERFMNGTILDQTILIFWSNFILLGFLSLIIT